MFWGCHEHVLDEKGRTSPESTYDWKSEQWTVPVNFMVTQMLKVGNQPLTLQAGARYWADSPQGAGPEGWGFRIALTFLFPK